MTRIDPPLPFLSGGQSQGTAATNTTGPVSTVTLADSPPSLARLTAGSILEGVVLNQDGRGLTQLRTEHGTVAFRTQLSLPKGAQLVLQVQTTGSQIQVGILAVRTPLGETAAARPAGGTNLPVPAAGTGTPAPAPVPADGLHAAVSLAGRWPTLEAALAALTAAGAPAAQALQAMIPQPNANVAPALLFFIAALTRGDVRSWLGSEIGRALTGAGRRDIADRLAEDFRLLSRVATESGRSEWRVLLLPFSDGEQVSQVRFFLRRDRSPNRGSDDAEPPPARFIFEIDLSRLGRLQLDGLAGKKRFDLMVRSLEPLPQEVRAEIAAIFATARADARLDGDIAFQTVPAFVIAPLEAALGPDAGVVV